MQLNFAAIFVFASLVLLPVAASPLYNNGHLATRDDGDSEIDLNRLDVEWLSQPDRRNVEARKARRAQ
ncbi:hypothetical protein OH77DRAFT_1521699 [Trametes cingulata]|nr:hypothetical protein OH77DRAFT_1521699 [Trametes cingulata]